MLALPLWLPSVACVTSRVKSPAWEGQAADANVKGACGWSSPLNVRGKATIGIVVVGEGCTAICAVDVHHGVLQGAKVDSQVVGCSLCCLQAEKLCWGRGLDAAVSRTVTVDTTGVQSCQSAQFLSRRNAGVLGFETPPVTELSLVNSTSMDGPVAWMLR